MLWSGDGGSGREKRLGTKGKNKKGVEREGGVVGVLGADRETETGPCVCVWVWDDFFPQST